MIFSSSWNKKALKKNAYLINDEKGLEDFGSSAYFVRKSWYQEKVKPKILSNK